MRLALRYVLIYALVMGLALAALLWSNSRYVSSELKTDLKQEFASLEEAFEAGGSERLAQTVIQRNRVASEGGRLYLLVSPNGKKLGGDLLAWPTEASISFDSKVRNVWIEEEVLPRTLFGDDARLPVIARQFPDGSRLLLAGSVQQSERLQEFAEDLMEALPLALILALAMGVTMGHVILGRMDTISRAASEIMAGNLSQRVPVSQRKDEFDALARHLNMMLDRTQDLIKGIREVTDNIAHDLRSPLARLRNRLEITLLEPRSEEEYREAIHGGIEDTDALMKTFNALLEIAQAEAGVHRTTCGPVELDRLASDLVDLYRPVAEEKEQALELKNLGSAIITGSRDLLAQVIGNLLENAIKYTPRGGLIHLKVAPAQDVVEVVVSDTGLGIPESERDHVLERFVRLEDSRHTPGNGLGLSLVRAVSRLHNAELLLGDANPGLIVTIRFPCAQR
ncbi:MAG: sensor histidine kinase [Burkholderiales bacterium]